MQVQKKIELKIKNKQIVLPTQRAFRKKENGTASS